MTEREALNLLLKQGYQVVWEGAQPSDLAAFISNLQGSGWAEVSMDFNHPSCRIWGLSPNKRSTLLYNVCKDQHPL